MIYLYNAWYNFLAIQNNIIINLLLFGNIIYPTYFNDKLVYYKNIGDNYYKYIFILNIGEKIHKQYKIDVISIGLNLYSKYKMITNKNDDNLSVISDISDISNLSDISNFDDLDDFY